MGNFKKTSKEKKNSKDSKIISGRIGKPQKSRKHKIKTVSSEPFERSKKQQKNLEPNDEDELFIPRGVKEIMKAQKDLKYGKKKKWKRRAIVGDSDKGVTKPIEKAPKFNQHKHESDSEFVHRIDEEAEMKLMHYRIKAQLKDPSDMEMLKKGKNSKGEKVKKMFGERKKEKNRERKKKKAEAMKLKKLEKQEDFADFKDDVMFGEVVDEPPLITAKPRKAQSSGLQDKPGTKSLLLKQMFEENTVNSDKHLKTAQTILSSREVGKTVKRKHLSFAQQRMNDAEREKAINLYRHLKSKKMSATDVKPIKLYDHSI